MSEPKRLHPIAAVVNMLRQLKELIVPLIVFVVFGSSGDGGNQFYLIAVAGGLFLVFISGIIFWYRFTYRVEDGELRIEHGLFVRKKRYIPFERIQSLDVSEGILQRPFGLVKVKVETAGGAGAGEAEAVLTAIRKNEANEIHDLLVKLKKSTHAVEEGEQIDSKETVIYKISFSELLLLASTSGGVGVVISAVFAFFLQFEEFIPFDRVFNEVEQFISSGLVFISIIIFLGFLLAWVISVVGSMLKYADFTLKRVDDDLIITRGLLEKRQFTIPLKRIQAVRVCENLLRQPLGMASVFVDSAGGSALNEESSKVLILPIIKKQKITRLLEPYLDDYQLNSELHAVPSRAYIRYLLKGWFIAIPIVLVVVFLFRPWGYFSVALLVASALWSWLKYRDAGWRLHDGLLTLRFRTLVKSTVFMKREKVQSLTIKQSHFQTQKSLATIDAVVKSGHGGSGGKVYDLDWEDTKKIYDWFSREED